jgi:glutathione S-transferase
MAPRIAMKARLYAIPASHPSFAAGLMVGRKGIPYSRVDLPQWFHRGALRVVRFPGRTGPALVLDGRRVQTLTAIARVLDDVRPEPRLVPRTPSAARRSRSSSAGPTATCSSTAAGSCSGRCPATRGRRQLPGGLPDAAALRTQDDLKPLIEPRPAGALSRRIAVGYPGRMPPAFPASWLPAAAAE